MQALVSSFIRSLSRPAEIVIVVMIFAGWFIYASLQAVLAGFPAFPERARLQPLENISATW